MEGRSGQMDRKTTTNRRTRNQEHPYQELEASPTWKSVDRAINALAKNGDIQETTRREYIVGYICKMIEADAKTGRPNKHSTTREAKS